MYCPGLNRFIIKKKQVFDNIIDFTVGLKSYLSFATPFRDWGLRAITEEIAEFFPETQH